MMKKSNRIRAILIACMMSLAITVPAGVSVYATEGSSVTATNTPMNTDTASITVKNVVDNATVTAYKIVEATYGTTGSGLVGYTPVSGVTIADTTNITLDELVNISNDAKLLKSLNSTTLTQDSKTKDYSVSGLGAGSYLILVTGTNDVVYNPMVVSINYANDSDIDDGSIDVTDDGYWWLQDKQVVAKASKPTVEKLVIKGNTANHGNTFAIGDTVSFQIDTTVPSYSDQYQDVTFEVSDTLSEGLTLKNGTIKVTQKDNANKYSDIDSSNYTIDTTDDSISISFNEDYIFQNGLANVHITYDATLNEDATTNFNSNDNTVTITYSNSPTTTTTSTDITHQYTFELDATSTNELLKTDEKDASLNGAIFKLTNKTTKKQYTATSDSNGRLNFKGLDTGTYTLVETTAPNGYSINTTEYTINVATDDTSFNDKGELLSYTVTISGNGVTKVFKYTKTDNGFTTQTGISLNELSTVEEATPYTIKNTKIPNLPTTGGMGIVLFALTGCVGMPTAVALYFKNRKKPE